jgi:hypothetical protein
MDNNMTPAALHLLKVSTFGTALYGFYMAYALHQKKEIQKKYIALPTFPQTDFERAYLTFLMSGNGDTLVIKHSLESTLRRRYGVRLDQPLKPFIHDESNQNWHDYRALIHRVWNTFQTPFGTQDKTTFCKTLLSLFTARPETSRSIKSVRTDFKAYIEECMCITLNNKLGDAAFNANEDLKARNPQKNEAERAQILWNQCVASGSLNDEEATGNSPTQAFHVFHVIQTNCT